MNLRPRWQALSQDARNSLIAAGSVTLIFAAVMTIALLLQDVELPRWTPIAALTFFGLQLLVQTILWLRRRRRPASGR